MIGDKIRELRISRGDTQETIAKQLNVSPQSISKWERNKSLPDISLLVPIADYFGVTVDHLLREAHANRQDAPEKVVEIKITRRNPVWRCHIKNISNRELKTVALKAYFYDKDGNIVDSKSIHEFNIEPGTVQIRLLTSFAKDIAEVKAVVKEYKFVADNS